MSHETIMNLSQFCQPESSTRYDIDEPFIADGYEYATDCRIIVRQPSSLPNTQGRRLPDATGIFNALWKDGDSHPLPNPEYIIECDECTGGSRACGECGHVAPCEHCAGTGFERTWLGRFTIDVRYYFKILTIPDVKYRTLKGTKEVLFEAGDVQGILAVMTEDGTSKVMEREEQSVSHGE